MELVKGVDVDELTLLEETIEKIKGLKMYDDFNVIVNRNLLNPSLQIQEALIGVEIVTEIIFIKYSQEFYIPSTKETLCQSEVIQHIKRAFIPWITGEDYSPSRELTQIKEELLTKLDPFRTGEYVEFVKKVEDLLSYDETMDNFEKDYQIELFEAETAAEKMEVTFKYLGTLNKLSQSFNNKFSKVREMESELQGKTGIISKLVSWFS